MKNKELKILLSAPRGFCAGVERAIEIVEKSILKYGAPVYVRHEIVHNKFVVDDLKSKGAVFVEELEEIEDKTRPVIFSAHGVPKKVPEDAKNYNMTVRRRGVRHQVRRRRGVLRHQVRRRRGVRHQVQRRARIARGRHPVQRRARIARGRDDPALAHGR